MNSEQLFELALGLQSPWRIDRVTFTETESSHSQLEIHLNFPRGSKFKDGSGTLCPVHDTIEREWQHLDFFQHRCILRARVPRIRNSAGKVEQVKVPWARPLSGFTLLFEAFALCLVESEMPVKRAASVLKVYPQRVWKVFNYWIERAQKKDDQSQVETLGVDETSSKKGHAYVTLAADMQKRRVLFATPGKGAETMTQLAAHLKSKNVKPEQIKKICIDMSPAFISGVQKEFPAADIVFDRFHVNKMLNEAMDEVRRRERAEHEALKRHKYTFLKNPENLTDKQKIQKAQLIIDYPTLGEAVRLKELFNDFWQFQDKELAMGWLAWWCEIVEESAVQPFKKFVNTIKAHWTGIVNYVEAKISNGVLEGINSKIQLAKRRARGYRNIDNFINMIHFIAGKLEFDYPHKFI